VRSLSDLLFGADSARVGVIANSRWQSFHDELHVEFVFRTNFLQVLQAPRFSGRLGGGCARPWWADFAQAGRCAAAQRRSSCDHVNLRSRMPVAHTPIL